MNLSFNLNMQKKLCFLQMYYPSLNNFILFILDLQAFALSSLELQVLTGSCFKLRTVHNMPIISNKDGKCICQRVVVALLLPQGGAALFFFCLNGFR